MQHLVSVWRTGTISLERSREGNRELHPVRRGIPGDETLQAVCTCGWRAEHKRQPPYKAVEDAEAHLLEQDPMDVYRNQAPGPWRSA